MQMGTRQNTEDEEEEKRSVSPNVKFPPLGVRRSVIEQAEPDLEVKPKESTKKDTTTRPSRNAKVLLDQTGADVSVAQENSKLDLNMTRDEARLDQSIDNSRETQIIKVG